MARLIEHDTGMASIALTPDAPFEPITVRISMAVKLTGISRSRLYQLIKDGNIETVKVGRSTLVHYRSLKKLAGL